MPKWFVVIRDITEYEYVVEAPDEQHAGIEADKLFKIDGGAQGEYQETSVRWMKQEDEPNAL